MNIFQEIIFIILYFIIIINATSLDNLDEIFDSIYSKMSMLPTGSTIYFSKTGKCSTDNNSPIYCLINENFYEVKEDNYTLLGTIQNYSDNNYYELNIIYNYSGDSNTQYFIIYFENSDRIIFKYYNKNNCSQIDYYYYNTSLNPINKGINCRVLNDFEKIVCYYLNKNNIIKEIEIKIQNETANLTGQFKTSNIRLNNFTADNDTFIMTSVFNKYNYFMCLDDNLNKSFAIFKEHFNYENHLRNLENKAISIDLPIIRSSNKFDDSNYFLDKNKINFECDIIGKLFLFAFVHKKNYYGYCPNFLNEINSINLNLTFFEDDKTGPESNKLATAVEILSGDSEISF